MKGAAVTLLALVAFAACAVEPPRRVNYDETKAGGYRLEDPLVADNGRRIASPVEWPARRREILALLEREEYGSCPPPPDTLAVDPVEEGLTFHGTARRRQFAMHFRADRSGPRIDWLLIEPVAAVRPAPVVIILNGRGNQEVLPDPEVKVLDAWVPRRSAGSSRTPNRMDASSRGRLRWPLDMVVARGYAVLTACREQAAPDPDDDEMPRSEACRRCCHTLWPETQDTGALMVWGWALSRGLDLAERLPSLDAGRAVAFGCSRLGKAALLAGAFDARFRVVVPCETGGAGVPLQKRNFGEDAFWMSQVFPHWFGRGYFKYAGNEKSMPFDQHFLLAAVAPRHLLVEGFDEPWYDTRGEYLACRAASPVWEFLGRPGIPGGEWPAAYSTAAVGTHLGYVRRSGSHGISGCDWKWMLDFADRAFAAADTKETGK